MGLLPLRPRHVARPGEGTLPEQRREERGASGNPALAGNASTVGSGGTRQAGLQAVVLGLFAHLRRLLPGQPVVEVVVHLRAPFHLGRERPGTEATVAPHPIQGIAQMYRLSLPKKD